MRARVLPAALAAMLLLGWPVGASPEMGTEAQRETGRKLYDKYCSQCHGVSGDGVGHATPRVKPQPRDFTSGKYKFRTTPSGAMPTDADLIRAIREGLPYTSMPGWPAFSDQEVKNIVYYLKTFSDDFQDAEKNVPPIEIPTPPPIDEESIARGKILFDEQGCAACHGELGRGDGISGPTLTDDWGQHLRAADMTMRWTFRGGATREDIFRTFSTGLNGTPMPSYGDTLAVESRWDLVNYIYSMGSGDDPNYSELLVARHVDEPLDLERADELFAEAPESRFALVGQIVQTGRNFYPSATSIQVQAVHNGREVALRLRWNDMRAETSGTNSPTEVVPAWDEDQPGGSAGAGAGEDDDPWGGALEDEADPWAEEGADPWGDEGDAGAASGGFSDAVAIQFPSQLPSGVRKPYFMFGDVQNSVDLWFIDLARKIPQQFVGRGSDSVDPAEGDDIEISAEYDRGQWTVVCKRSMRSSAAISFQEDQFVPIAFSVWDGFNRERGNKRALSSWFHVYWEPSQVVSPVGPMVRAGIIVLILEILLIWFIRRKYRAGVPAVDKNARDGILPHGGATA